jgi:tetratricopeptide (TPR) repeat protein
MGEFVFTPSEALDRAVSAYRAGKFSEAENLAEQIVAIDANFFDALYLLAVVQWRLDKHQTALLTFDRAISLQPNDAMAHHNRAHVLQALKRFEDALASLDRAIELRPDNATAYSDRGTTLHALTRYEEALACYEKAISLQSNYPVAHYNRGLALHELKRGKEAIASYDEALKLRPNFAEARLNQSLSRLLIGDLEDGWLGYEWRNEVKSPGNSKRIFPQPHWFGHEDISGKTILLHAEQGYGDTIQFCRYVPLVAARGACVILEVPAALVELMESLNGPAQIVSKGDPLPNFDIHCPLLSLPLAFGTQIDTIPAAVPYLRASPQNVMDWNNRLGPKSRARIGLAWSGQQTHPNDFDRSIPLTFLLPILGLDASFISLQKDLRAEDANLLALRPDLRHFGNDLKNFSDTAALVTNLDLIISIDTSIVHLAGALAKPVWAMLPFTPDWRWLLDRLDSPWYPTARLFRQYNTRAWPPVIADVRAAVGDFIRNRGVLTYA